MTNLLSDQNLLIKHFENKVIKKWSYNFIALDKTSFTKYIICVHNPHKKIEKVDLENEYEYTSFISKDENLQLEIESNNLYYLKYEEWINKYFIPVPCIIENRDLRLGVDYVRFLNGELSIIPHVVCPHLLNYNINELSLVYFKEAFCEKNNLL